LLRFDDRDGRILVARVCPLLGECAVVDDGAGTYSEAFVPGVFSQQIEEAKSRPLRVWLDVAHRKDLVIGHAVRLRELDGGLYGDFAVHAGVVGDQVLAAVRGGRLTSVSVMMTPLRSRTVDGVTRREKAHLVGVALVPKSAYANAEVLGIRKARRDDQPGPASAVEFILWDLENRDAKLRALQMQYLDEALEMRAERRRTIGAGRSYATDPRYQRATKLRCEIAEQRAEIEQHLLQPAATEGSAPHPQRPDHDQMTPAAAPQHAHGLAEQ
jgi:HK97 family phage prohead protease